MLRAKVKSLSPDDRLVIALHSPDRVAKLDCVSALRRKRPQTMSAEFGKPLSPVRLKDESRTLAAISSDFQGKASGFLCSADCMAEREGFESAVKRKFNNIQSNGRRF